LSRIKTSVIAVLLLGLAAYVGVLLFANLNAVVATDIVKGWQKKGDLPDEDRWQRNLDRIQAAIKLDSANPEYLATEAELFRYRAYMIKKAPFLDANRKALAKYQHLLTLRPSWAPYWTSIIAIKYELWEYDALMIDALRNAARLAPWFKRNQHIILKAGIHGWAFIDAETRGVVEKTLERAMLLQPEPTMRLALDQGFMDRIYPYVEDDEKLKEMYQRYVESMKKKLKSEK